MRAIAGGGGGVVYTFSYTIVYTVVWFGLVLKFSGAGLSECWAFA